MIGFIVGIAWNVLLTTLFITDPHPHMDKKRCYTNQVEWAQYCWPKDGCWITENGDVMCWRVVKVKAQ